MEFTVRCCDACPRPEVMPDEDELVPTDVLGVYLFDDELAPFSLTLGAAEEEQTQQSGVLCPMHVAALRWLLQAEATASL